MAGPGICVLCLADTCPSEVHPVFNPVAPYGYLLSDMYLFMADITNPDFINAYTGTRRKHNMKFRQISNTTSHYGQ